MITLMNWKMNQFKEYCIKNKIPIITDEALAYIKEIIKENNIKSILEIGSAIGYSAINFSSNETFVDTIERDLFRVNEAKKWIKHFKANVNVIAADALLYDKISKTYDLIFIDAAKAQYQKFFNKYEEYLNDGGYIISDNMNFHNLKIEEVKNRGTKNLLKRLALYKEFLINNSLYDTEFLNIGDGLAISRKIKND